MCVSLCVCVCLCTRYLLNYWSDFDEIWYASSLGTLVVPFGGLDPRGEISPQMRGKFRFFNLGLYLLKLLSDFDETWYVIFSSNVVLYFGGLDSVGKFPRQGGKGEKF